MPDAAKAEDANKEVVLFRKAIDADREVVVVRSAIHPLSDLAPPTSGGKRAEDFLEPRNAVGDPNLGFLDNLTRRSAADILARPSIGSGADTGAERFAGCCTVFLQVVPRKGEPITVATRLMAVPRERPSGGIVVYDALWDQGNLVLAIGTFELELWKVRGSLDPARVNMPLSLTVTLLHGWSAAAAPSYLDRNSLSVRLSLAKDGRVQAEVDDLQGQRATTFVRHQTQFIQSADKWQFTIQKKE